MYDMYPATWRVVDESERSTRHHRHGSAPSSRRRRRTVVSAETEAVQKAMNRRDNGGEPVQ